MPAGEELQLRGHMRNAVMIPEMAAGADFGTERATNIPTPVFMFGAGVAVMYYQIIQMRKRRD